jgi:hypothetical protein
VDEVKSCRPAICGWGAVATIVVGYDVWALLKDRETLSGAFWRARGHRHVRYVALSVWAGLTWHLLFGDKRVAPVAVSLVYRRTHPLWAANELLKQRANRSTMTTTSTTPDSGYVVFMVPTEASR